MFSKKKLGLILILALLFVTFLFVRFNTKNALKNQDNLNQGSNKDKDSKTDQTNQNSDIDANIDTGQNLQFLKLPNKFSISVFAKEIGPARVMRLDNKGQLVASITKDGKIMVLSDNNNDGRADKIVTVLEGLNRPHGIDFKCTGIPDLDRKSCKLYVAETGRISAYDYNSESMTATNRKKIIDLPAGGNHFTRTIAFGPDNRLYLAVGSSCNVCVEKDNIRTKIHSMNPDGSDFKPVASGLRNAVFFSWHPVSGKLWATEMGRDLLGDDLPPDEINIIEPGRNYGWPYCYGKQKPDRSFQPRTTSLDCNQTEPSHIDLQAHSAPLGLAFVPEKGWPGDYSNDLLVAFHGSWNRSTPTGYKIVRLKLDSQGRLEGIEDLIAGWLGKSGVLGRPVDLLFDGGGRLYISDDKANSIYRVTYKP